MKQQFLLPLFALMVTVLASSCSKGYEMRFANYSTERMDSVIVGDNSLIFTNVARQSESNYEKIKRGTYDVVCISESKKRFTTSITIAKTGSGKRSLQIDGTGAINFLED
jgi:hypothetical protein